MAPYVVLEKEVGETPLIAVEKWRAKNPSYTKTALAYAGRLDPMASGKLLVLIGEECKKQSLYHDLDKEYEFEVMFGIGSDTSDVLGRLEVETSGSSPDITPEKLESLAKSLEGQITLPYPIFSSKTVEGKPLHQWTLENRLDEIVIPERTSTILKLQFNSLYKLSRADLVTRALAKIETIPPVTDPKKALGKDFRREDIRIDWQKVANDQSSTQSYVIAKFTCICSSGTYMRTLASLIARKSGTLGLAFSIHRTKIGQYDQKNNQWVKEY